MKNPDRWDDLLDALAFLGEILVFCAIVWALSLL